MQVTTTWYLVLGAMLFSLGGTGLLVRDSFGDLIGVA